MIESGKLNWEKGWNPEFGLPQNYITRKPYRGINSLLTMFSGYSSPYWLTFDQAKKLKGFVRAEEKGTPIVYWSIKERTRKETDPVTGEETQEKFSYRILRYSTVFNSEQVEGMEFEKPDGLKEYGTIADIENVLNEMPEKPLVKFGGGRAYYSPSFDHVGMPDKGSFVSLEEYYSTLFHEFVHSTGHTSRLNRATVMGGGFDRHDQYSFEELIAEFGAAFLNAMFGIDTKDVEENSAAYLQSWTSKLKKDPQLLYKAAGAAQKGVDFILGKVKYEEESLEEQVAKAA